MKNFKTFFLLFFIFLLSCSQELDFNQIKNVTISPTYTFSLLYFTLPATIFLDGSGNEIKIPPITKNINNFKNESVVKSVFNFEIKNELNRSITLKINLLDENNVIIYSFKKINVLPKNLAFKQNETIEITSTSKIYNTRKISIDVDLISSGETIQKTAISEFTFKASMDFYTLIK